MKVILQETDWLKLIKYLYTFRAIIILTRGKWSSREEAARIIKEL